jgi:hypothetical protein
MHLIIETVNFYFMNIKQYTWVMCSASAHYSEYKTASDLNTSAEQCCYQFHSETQSETRKISPKVHMFSDGHKEVFNLRNGHILTTAVCNGNIHCIKELILATCDAASNRGMSMKS